jgi:hypothetical protein
MPQTLTCPGCRATLRVRDDLAGKTIKCPRCAGVVPVPAGKAATAGDRPAADEEFTEVQPLPSSTEEDEEEALRKKCSKFKPCPRCGGRDARRVRWTPWGSFYGPKLFNHVRCPDCGYAYNGRTGRSNLIPILVSVTIPLIGIVAALVAIAYIFHRQGYF